MSVILLRSFAAILQRLSRMGFIAGFVLVFVYVVLASLPYLAGNPHANATTASLAAAVAPWIVGTCAVYALGQLAATMIRTWLEDHGNAPNAR